MEIAKLILDSITIILLIYNLIVHLQIYRKQKLISNKLDEALKKSFYHDSLFNNMSTTLIKFKDENNN